MCGLAGLISLGSHVDAELIIPMTHAVRHRGPDDEGYWALSPAGSWSAWGGRDTPPEVFGAGLPSNPHPTRPALASAPASVVLGHRRLSIVDLSPAGHQPMCSADGRYWIVYNGEIYNHLELRAELAAAGARFHSRSDTEVILESYRHWGSGCLHRFNGMFAFVLVDVLARRAFLARDRFGVKPLYVWQSPRGYLAVASEIKQFATLPGWQPRLNAQRAYDFLSWGVLDHSRETLFSGVMQLRGGESLEVQLDAPSDLRSINDWYQLAPRRLEGPHEQAPEQFKQVLEDAVRLRLRADVEVGSCLSGGLDSSTIVCLMSGLLGSQDAQSLQRTFSARSETRRFDEGRFIEAVVAHTGVKAAHVYPSAEHLFTTLDDLIRHQDEPFGSSSIYAQWSVFQLAAKAGVKVMLDGQGADETLAGYPTFYGPLLATLLRGGRLGSLYSESHAAHGLLGHSWPWLLKQLANSILPEWLRQPLRGLSGVTTARPNWIDIDRLGAEAHDPSLGDSGERPRTLTELSLAQVTRTNLPMLLHWEDRDSMAHSVEARLPFLDYRVVELVLGLPDSWKLQGGNTKRVLREATHGLLPEVIRTRRDKMGFVTAEETWLREAATAGFRGALSEAIEASNGILRGSALTELDEIAAGRRRFNQNPWRAITFGKWMTLFGVSN